MSSDNSTPEETPHFYIYEDSITESASDGGLDSYERELGFNRNNLEGKRVLDLGAGQTDRLARDLKEAGINAEVVSVSPDFRRGVNRDILTRRYPEWKRKGVAAIAQQLPFKDDSFDVILAAYSVINFASNDSDSVQTWISEIARVLKLGGEARLGPTYGLRNFAFGKNNEVLIESAKKSGLELTINDEPTRTHIYLKKVSLDRTPFNFSRRKFVRKSNRLATGEVGLDKAK